MNWRFSLSDRRFQSSLSLEAFHNFFQGKSGFLQVHFKLNCIGFRNLDFFFKSVLSFLFEFSDISSRIDIDSSQFILLIGLLFVKFESESSFSVCVKVRNVKVQLTTSKRHDVSTIGLDKVSLGGNFILVKLLHAFDNKNSTFVDWELELGLGRWYRLLEQDKIDWVQLKVVRLGSGESEGPIDHM